MAWKYYCNKCKQELQSDKISQGSQLIYKCECRTPEFQEFIADRMRRGIDVPSELMEHRAQIIKWLETQQLIFKSL